MTNVCLPERRPALQWAITPSAKDLGRGKHPPSRTNDASAKTSTTLVIPSGKSGDNPVILSGKSGDSPVILSGKSGDSRTLAKDLTELSALWQRSDGNHGWDGMTHA